MDKIKVLTGFQSKSNLNRKENYKTSESFEGLTSEKIENFSLGT
jgi:hypothetical protein